MNWSWIAGFYEGEGYAGLQEHVGTGKSWVVHLSISQCEKSVLDAIRRFVGYGKVYPQDHCWSYQLYGKNAVSFAEKILPVMNSKRKIRQLKKAIS